MTPDACEVLIKSIQALSFNLHQNTFSGDYSKEYLIAVFAIMRKVLTREQYYEVDALLKEKDFNARHGEGLLNLPDIFDTKDRTVAYMVVDFIFPPFRLTIFYDCLKMACVD
jgi:hypothetical protein